jgi:alkylation response protein AidB-like acyl-CoA dehydrogenase
LRRKGAPEAVEQFGRAVADLLHDLVSLVPCPARGYREVPMLLIGEGTAEIQKMIVGRRLLEEYRTDS